MKNTKPQTAMPNNIAKALSSPDTYRYVALSFSPDKRVKGTTDKYENYTDSTFKQIAEKINPVKPESELTVKNFVDRLKKAKDKDGNPLIKIDDKKRDEKGNQRNHFYMLKPHTNFRLIKKEFLYLDLDIKLKGFLLQLLSITQNETLKVGYSIARISREVKVSRPAATKYMAELIKEGFVKEVTDGYELMSEYFDLGKTSREKEIEEIREFAKTSKFFTDKFNSIKWEDVRTPKEYWEASVIMRLRGEEKLRGDTDNNLIITL